MKISTYLKYKKEVINNFNRCKKNELGMISIDVFLSPVKRNKQLFFYLFSYDTKPFTTNIVASIKLSKYKNYQGNFVSKIKLGDSNLLEKYYNKETYENILKYFIKNK